MYKSSDIRKPRYKVIILAAPIVPLSRGLTVLSKLKKELIISFLNLLRKTKSKGGEQGVENEKISSRGRVLSRDRQWTDLQGGGPGRG